MPTKTIVRSTLPKILLAEGEPFLRGVYEAKLAEEGYAVTAVGEGEAALAAARQNPFDAILLACDLPKLDGFEVLKRLRRNAEPDKAATPILMLSRRGEKDEVGKGLMLGANEIIIVANEGPGETAKKIKQYVK